MKLIKVHWHDAWSHDEQCDIDLAATLCAKPMNTQSVGFLVHEDENCVVIARDLLQDDNKVSGIINIPKDWIDGEIEILEDN